MRNRLLGGCGLLVLALTSVLKAAQSQTEKCDALQHVAVPIDDLPTEAKVDCDIPGSPHRWNSNPDALLLYYSNFPGHFEQARRCAFTSVGLTQRNNGQVPPAEQGFEGRFALTLAMIYANGEGVTRNLPLARQFVCEDSDGVAISPSDELLGAFEKAIKTKNNFDACENGGEAFGRAFSYECLGLQQMQAVEEIRNREESIMVSISPSLRSRFVALRDAYHDFQAAYSEFQATVCEGGTGCGPIMESYDLAVDKVWITALASVQSGSLPCSGVDASSLAQLDSDLNQKYKEALKNTYMDIGDGDKDKSLAPFVRAADRAWLRYRDAWVSYGHLRWPTIPADQWRAWQTKEWLQLLTM